MSSYEDLKFSRQLRNRKGAYFKCEKCKRIFYRFRSLVIQSKKRGNRVRYCSMSCYDKTGKNNPFYGGKHKRSSILKMKTHPNRSKFKKGLGNPNFIRWASGKKVYISISKIKKYIVMKKGKCEDCGFNDKRILTIHHMDKNKHNNKPFNLRVLCPNCHSLRHAKEKPWPVGIINDGNKIEDVSTWEIDHE